ncbi:acyl-CoA dehydrogenase family protein [Mycolicibacterium stellerae]|uniref:acyl-CoA dehydrogenase family protein n=1 Tax=Mycolicibacterium stellerae TaxID=2358193 RepID=UPI000F0AFA21|nr:acyl-CoA dehydrogenase family protein [Mycolicibacterium stellerae]
MDLRYSTEHDDFRDSLRRFLRDHSRPGADGCRGHDAPLWRLLCGELELLGLHVAARYGGADGTLVDTAIAFEEAGRALAAVPLLSTTLAVEAVLRMGDDAQCAQHLPGLLSGERIGALAAARPADVSAPTVRAEYCGGRTVLVGECAPVLHGHVADLFVVPANTGAAVVPHIVAGDAPGVTVVPLPSFDGTRPVARLELAQAPADALTGGTPDDFERVLDTARILLAAEMLGGAEACLALAVEHARSRHQFGRPIGSFQAVKHACADMMIEIDATRALVMFAAMSADVDAERRINAPLAKAQAADTYLLCANSAIQVHGGIGFTWEHDLHRYFRRAHTTAALFGGSAQHRALVADRAAI